MVVSFLGYNLRFVGSLLCDCREIIDRLPDHYLGWSLVENSFVLIGEAAKSLEYTTLAETSHVVSLLGGSCAAADVFWDFLRDVKNAVSFNFKMKDIALRKIAMKIEELSYVAMLLDKTTFVKMASPLLARCNVIASGAALFYNLIDIGRHGLKFFETTQVEITEGVISLFGEKEKAEEFAREAQLLRWVEIEKTALHIIVDILGVLSFLLGIPISVPIITASCLSSYCIMTLWSRAKEVELSEKACELKGEKEWKDSLFFNTSP